VSDSLYDGMHGTSLKSFKERQELKNGNEEGIPMYRALYQNSRKAHIDLFSLHETYSFGED
jgi:hypothetical protein